MIEDYRKARKQGKRQVSADVAAGRHPYLPSLDEVLEGRTTAGEVSVGVREIPLELVVGTKTRGRSNVFSSGFLPTAEEGTEFATKWSRLYDAQVSEGIRDPVVVYEYLQRFYVQEGNKRVSVLRYLEAPTILASVTRVLPAESDDPEVRSYAEFCDFYRVAPVYGLVFTQEGAYARLASVLGLSLDEPWPEDAVRGLNTTLYMFARSYRARGGGVLPQTVADALLVYLASYATANPLHQSEKEVDRRVARIWGELVVAAQEEPIAYIESPDDHKGGMVSAVKGITRAVQAAVPLRRTHKALKLAFVYDRDATTSGWVALHEQGRLALEQRMAQDVHTVSFAGCASDEDFLAAVDTAVADGADVVVTSSPRQMEQTRQAAVAHPKQLFVNCSVNLSSSTVRSFYARMYEVKYVMGALAASLAENHRVGYVATSPIYGSVSEINAFAQGAALVDPYATVHLKWLTTEGYDWRRELRDDDVLVICGRDYVDPANPGDPYGLYLWDKDGAVQEVAKPVWDWGRYYELLVRSINSAAWSQVGSEHRNQAVNYWWGMPAGVVRMELGEGIAAGSKRLVRLLTKALLDEQVHPFEGPLVAQKGEIVRDEDAPRLTNEEIASMRWLNYNVVGRLPKQWELSEEGARAVAASGVIDAQTDAQED